MVLLTVCISYIESGGGVMTSVQVRCVIERVVDGGCSSSVVDSTTAELDSVAAVPASLPFHDLPQFILVARGYSAAESLACRGTYSRQRLISPPVAIV